MNTFDDTHPISKDSIDVGFQNYVNMNQLKMNCLFDTVSLIC